LALLTVHDAAIQYVEHFEGDGAEMFEAACKLGLEGIVSKRLDAPYRSGPSKSWIKVKNPKARRLAQNVNGNCRQNKRRHGD
jgi:ATP-dependent DNA ligase